LSSSARWEPVSYREEKRILDIVDRVASSRGTDRSAIIREATRFWLAANSLLPEQEKKDLGAMLQEAKQT
jgi:metal-responsive CopG/Arc/MetJ family transcriptional regulator